MVELLEDDTIDVATLANEYGETLLHIGCITGMKHVALISCKQVSLPSYCVRIVFASKTTYALTASIFQYETKYKNTINFLLRGGRR